MILNGSAAFTLWFTLDLIPQGQASHCAGLQRSISGPALKSLPTPQPNAAGAADDLAVASGADALASTADSQAVPVGKAEGSATALMEAGYAAVAKRQPIRTAAAGITADQAVAAAISEVGEAGTPVSSRAGHGHIDLTASTLPGILARRLSGAFSETGQSGTPMSHRISDVGSEDFNEPAEALSGGVAADEGVTSRPATPTLALLTPR